MEVVLIFSSFGSPLGSDSAHSVVSVVINQVLTAA